MWNECVCIVNILSCMLFTNVLPYLSYFWKNVRFSFDKTYVRSVDIGACNKQFYLYFSRLFGNSFQSVICWNWKFCYENSERRLLQPYRNFPRNFQLRTTIVTRLSCNKNNDVFNVCSWHHIFIYFLKKYFKPVLEYLICVLKKV